MNHYPWWKNSLVALLIGCSVLCSLPNLFGEDPALLAVIGYSLNDSIVVFDRVRENFRKLRGRSALEVIDISINETLSRTLLTSLTTLLAVLVLYLFGGELLRRFSLALMIGFVFGTSSSIYVASAAAVRLGVSRADLLPAAKQLAVADDRP